MKRITKKIFLISVTVLMSFSLFAGDMVVIGNKANSKAFNTTGIKNIFIGKNLNFLPIDQNRRKIRNAFYSTIVEKKYSAVKSIWGKLVFTGKASKPVIVGSDQAVIDVIVGDKLKIGYINKSSLTDSVKVLLEF